MQNDRTHVVIDLGPKQLRLLLQALDCRIAQMRQQLEDADRSVDQISDDSNDLALLDVIRTGLADAQSLTADRMHIYECWVDDGVALLPKENVEQHKRQGTLAEAAIFQYMIRAATWEEAMAIHYLRQGWGTYLPAGAPGTCAQCTAVIYPDGTAECWRCGCRDHSLA